MNTATIADLKVNPNAPLIPMVKKNLVDIIEDEFVRQNTIYNATADEKKEKILEQYKKSIGFIKLKKNHEKAQAHLDVAAKELSLAERKINMKGLTLEGQAYSQCYYGAKTIEQVEVEKACKKVEHLLNTVETQGPNNIKSKIISRLWLATTHGEAMVILREVLGNGIIPTIDKDQLALSYKGE